MWPLRPLLVFGCVFVSLHAGLGDKNRKKPELEFSQKTYAKELTEYHRINATVLHVRAKGCEGKISYSIENKGVPFDIDEKGRIWLMSPFNIDKVSSYNLTIKAVTKKCVAYAKVYFHLMNMNKHSPTFESDEYLCFITENTRSVHVLPKIRVTDRDHGEAGKIRKISIVESGIPFDIRFDQKNNGEAVMVVTEDIDAEKVSGYMFDIIAEDNGDPSRMSHPVHVNCQVVDVNEFAPQFIKSRYTATIHHGRAYDNVLMIEAEDKDVGAEYGKVCKYEIITPNVPFMIDTSGVVSLPEPLGPEALHQYTFQVSAVDCGGKTAQQKAVVTVTVSNDCHKGYVGPSKTKLTVASCDGTVYVTPDMGMNDCTMKAGKANFSALIHMDTPAGKGCDRDMYEASARYRICGADGVIDLLPKPWKGQEWTKELRPVKTHEGKKDDTSYDFDGKTVVEIPSHVVPKDLGADYTISTWMKTKPYKGKQVILASTDSDRLNRIHFALMTRNNHLEFKHRREPQHAKRDLYCKSDFHYYKTPVFDNKWHHVTVVVSGCKVQMYIDGVLQVPHETESNWPLHNSHLKTRLVVGGHWLGKEHKYTDYFKGHLSGMTIRPNKTTALQIIECFVACKEHISIDGPLPKGFSVNVEGFDSLRITGNGQPEDFHKVLRKVTYKNKCIVPTSGNRIVRIVSKSGEWPLPTVTVSINVKPAFWPEIRIKGCRIPTENNMIKRIKSFGVPVCRKMDISKKGCGKTAYLDSVEVIVKPPMKKGEFLMFPKSKNHGTILDDYEMTVYNSSDGIVIRGIADARAYELVMQEMVYVNIMPENNLHHKFFIKACDLNGRFESNQCEVELNVLHKEIKYNKPHNAQKVSREQLQYDALPGAVVMQANIAGTASASTSSGVMAAIIICSASVFVALVIIGIFRLRKSASKLEVDVSNAKEELYWDDTGLAGVCVTVNPMEKFQELDLNEDGTSASVHSESEEEDADVDNVGAKEQLEWDDM